MTGSRLDVCICTFRRPQLADTLRSLAAQDWPPGLDARILVVDNDDLPSAEPFVRAFATATPLPVDYLHRPGRNIALARNAALVASDAPLRALIDDDETAEPGWIAALLATLRREAATAVLGPVRPVYDERAPGWMRRGEVHATRPVWVGGKIVTGYTCNALVDRSRPDIAALRFDPALGRTGGEDTLYFAALAGLGGAIAFAPDAQVSERVPQQRASLGWLLRRRWRMGLTHARSTLGPAGSAAARAFLAVRALAKAAACAGGAAAVAPSALRRNRILMRGALHLGAAWGALGGRAPELYGAPAEPAE